MSLESELFGDDQDGVLGPYYVRLCCEFFASTCFVCEVDNEPAGYLLSFAKGREVYCTTMAIRPKYQGTRATISLLAAFVEAVVPVADVCWFTVDTENRAARSLHSALGAEETDFRPDFYGQGKGRIVSRIERKSFLKLSRRFERLGMLKSKPAARPVARPMDSASAVTAA